MLGAAAVSAAVAAGGDDDDGLYQLLNCRYSENTRTRPATAREGVAVEAAGADVVVGVDDEPLPVGATVVVVVAGDDGDGGDVAVDEELMTRVAERLEWVPHPVVHIHYSSASR